MLDINSLSTASKRELLDYLRKLEESKKSSSEIYTPRKYQEEFHKSQKIIRVYSGGNQIGTSTLGAGEVKYWVFGEHPYRKDIRVPSIGRIVTSQGFTTGIDQVIVPKLRQFIASEYIVHEERNHDNVPIRWDISNGSVIHFMSTEQPLKMHEGAVCDWVWIDEPPPFEFYRANLRGILSRQGSLWITLTPLLFSENLLWLYNELYEPWESGDIEVTEYVDFFFGSMRDALVENGGHITKAYFNLYKKSIPPEMHEIFIDGKFGKLSGRIFKSFDINKHVIPRIEWPREFSVIRSIDPHDAKPHAVVWIGIDDSEDFHVINEVSVDGTLQDLAKTILEVESLHQYRIIDSLVDPAINKEDKLTGIRQRDILAQDYGVECRFPQKTDMVRPGIMYLQLLLQNVINNHGRKLYIHQNCLKTIDNFKRYHYDKDRQIPKKEHDDYLDPIRYAVTSRPSFSKKRVDMLNLFNDHIETYGLVNHSPNVDRYGFKRLLGVKNYEKS